MQVPVRNCKNLAGRLGGILVRNFSLILIRIVAYNNLELLVGVRRPRSIPSILPLSAYKPLMVILWTFQYFTQDLKDEVYWSGRAWLPMQPYGLTVPR